MRWHRLEEGVWLGGDLLCYVDLHDVQVVTQLKQSQSYQLFVEVCSKKHWRRELIVRILQWLVASKLCCHIAESLLKVGNDSTNTNSCVCGTLSLFYFVQTLLLVSIKSLNPLYFHLCRRLKLWGGLNNNFFITYLCTYLLL